MDDFATNVLKAPLDGWERFVVIHGGELLPDGTPRFRVLLILVARQNGKTWLCVVLSLYWLFVDRVEMVLGTSTKLDYAAESWRKACKLAKRVPALAKEIPAKGGVRKANGEQVLWRADEEEYELEDGSRYRIAASNEEGGRSLTVHRLILDELRQHYDYSAWEASEPATSAVADAQIWCLSNAGNDRSVVLNDKRAEALDFINTGEGDSTLGLFEYSAPEGASPLDIRALLQANPNVGYRKPIRPLLAAARSAVKRGGEALATFKTNYMCQRVARDNPAIDPEGWKADYDPASMDGLRDRIAACFDISLDGQHAALLAAAQLDDGRTRVEVVRKWSGPTCMRDLREDLPGVVAKVKPRVLGWFPSGPAAAFAADMAERAESKQGPAWPPAGVVVEAIKSEVNACCMGFASLVQSRQIAHSEGDTDMLTLHVLAAEQSNVGDAWRYTRRGGAGYVDGAYAAAGATHLSRTLPPPPKPLPRPIVV